MQCGHKPTGRAKTEMDGVGGGEKDETNKSQTKSKTDWNNNKRIYKSYRKTSSEHSDGLARLLAQERVLVCIKLACHTHNRVLIKA